jgi:hypothetical protein
LNRLGRPGGGGAFDGEGIDYAAPVLDAGFGAAEEPEAAAIIEITGVARAVPDLGVNAPFGLVVALAVEIAGEDVGAVDDDFAGLARGKDLAIEIFGGCGGEGRAELIRDDAEVDVADRLAGEKAGAGEHGLGIMRGNVGPGDFGDGFGFGGTVDGGDAGIRNGILQSFEEMRKDRCAAGEEAIQRGEGGGVVGVFEQAVEKRRGGDTAGDAMGGDLFQDRSSVDIADVT